MSDSSDQHQHGVLDSSITAITDKMAETLTHTAPTTTVITEPAAAPIRVIGRL